MKKLLTFGCLILGIMFFSNSNALAQEGLLKVGGGLAYGLEAEAIGVQAKGVYGFTDEIDGAVDFIIFFPDVVDWWELNANVHYNFLAEEGTRVYGLGGLNYTTISVDFGGLGSASTSEVGLNIGGGAEFDVDFASIYTEAKFVISNADQLSLAAGLRFPI